MSELSGSNETSSNRLVNVKTAAEYLGVHTNTLRRWADDGLIRVVKFPSGVRRFRQEDVDSLYQQMNGGPREPDETVFDINNPEHVENFRQVALGKITVKEAGAMFSREGHLLTVAVPPETYQLIDDKKAT